MRHFYTPAMHQGEDEDEDEVEGEVNVAVDHGGVVRLDGSD